MRNSLHQTRHGLLSLIEGDFISNYVKCYGEWSEVEVAVFKEILFADSNVIEVGSNIGTQAVAIAKKIPQGKLFCFEPQRMIFQTLCCNLHLNRLSNVFAYQMGVGDSSGSIEIQSSNYDTPWNYGSFSLNKGFSTENPFKGEVKLEQIPLISLDEHPEIQKLTALRLLKIDAEGFELKVLEGAKGLIQRFNPLIFVEAHLHSNHLIFQKMTELGYRCYWIISSRYQANNYFNQPESLTGQDFNFLCQPCSQPPMLPEKMLVTEQNLKSGFPLIRFGEHGNLMWELKAS